jgi:hypothetical protein
LGCAAPFAVQYAEVDIEQCGDDEGEEDHTLIMGDQESLLWASRRARRRAGWTMKETPMLMV